MKESFIFLISGPSGAGKSTLLSKLLEDFKDELYFSISHTTRKPRNGEKDGIDYHFISKDEFEKKIKQDNFLEYALVHNNYYGTSINEVQKALNLGKIVVFDIDVQGFLIAREKFKDKICSVFISTKTSSELEKRLNNRNSMDANLKDRLINAEKEIKFLKEYDYLIINEDIAKSYTALKNIFLAEKLRIKRYNLDKILQEWKK
ncbi:guanylate kinase [uncultured Campylobacter sp.]|uniref:guanylate kinase n=1 Tax=uncultured Campylobacter sp. TaxID=218934 RepID=UPI002634DE71|nr:guanylate kinase [uncultured Campylobacter sp.]